MPNTAATISGTLIDRSRGQPGLGAPSSREIMTAFAPWPDFIMGFTGWSRVEPGTLTLERCEPPPGRALEHVSELSVEPPNLLDDFRPEYAQFLRSRRGLRRYYGALVRARDRDAVAVVSQQERPATPSRLEVYSNVRLRDVLILTTGDTVQVDLFAADVWRGHFADGA